VSERRVSERGASDRGPGDPGAEDRRAEGPGARGAEASAGSGDASRGETASVEPALPPRGEGPRAELTPSALRDFFVGVPRFARLVLDLMTDPRVSLFDRLLFGAAFAYLFVPLDVIPDWLPGIGQLDDLLVVLVALDRLLHRTPEHVLLEHWRGDPAPLLRIRDLLDRGARRLPGWARGLLRSG